MRVIEECDIVHGARPWRLVGCIRVRIGPSGCMDGHRCLAALVFEDIWSKNI